MTDTTLLLNLLAIIHRDGGEHTGKVGIEQSTEDATLIVASHHVIADTHLLCPLVKYSSPSP